MKRIVALVGMFLLLTGCGRNAALNDVDNLRQRLKAGEGIRFTAQITAIYTDSECSFSLVCETYSDGSMNFSVSAPETIEGIGGKIGSSGGSIIFEDVVLGFPLLSQGQISPVSGPWLFYNALTDGYIGSVSKTDEGLVISVEDSYFEKELRLDISVDSHLDPTLCSIYYDGSCIMNVGILDFVIK